MGEKQMPFSAKDLREMIIPLFMEQFLVMLVGIADSLVVSYAGEATVSGVSLVNQFNTIFIYLFTALASGGSVVISQYIGRKVCQPASDVWDCVFPADCGIGISWKQSDASSAFR